MQILGKEIVLYCHPTWPPCHVGANQEERLVEGNFCRPHSGFRHQIKTLAHSVLLNQTERMYPQTVRLIVDMPDKSS